MAGAIFVVIGLYFLLTAWSSMTIGTAGRMGPGYFPIMLAIVLILTGIGTALSGIGTRNAEFGRIRWRSMIWIVLAPIMFVATVQGLGICISLFLTTLCALMANPGVKLLSKVCHAAITSVLCTVVFKYGLEIQLPLLGSWVPFAGDF